MSKEKVIKLTENEEAALQAIQAGSNTIDSIAAYLNKKTIAVRGILISLEKKQKVQMIGDGTYGAAEAPAGAANIFGEQGKISDIKVPEPTVGDDLIEEVLEQNIATKSTFEAELDQKIKKFVEGQKRRRSRTSKFKVEAEVLIVEGLIVPITTETVARVKHFDGDSVIYDLLAKNTMGPNETDLQVSTDDFLALMNDF